MSDKVLKGEFFTPKEWVDTAHHYISDTLQDDWKERAIVWDCAAGHQGLTSGYTFKSLYLSTINQEDVDYIKQTHSSTFVFDFLNGDISDIPNSLIKSFMKNKEIIFFMNPPFGKVKSFEEDTSYDPIRDQFPKTYVSSLLEKEKIGKSPTSQFYIQFLYRIILLKKTFNLTNIKIAMFSPPFFLCGTTFKRFRKIFFEHFKFKGGFLMNANNFKGVGSWRLSFSIFELGKENKSEFEFDVLENDIKFLKKKLVYNTDNETRTRGWVQEGLPKDGYIDHPQLSSSLKWKEKGRGVILPGSLGFFYNDTNYIKKNIQGAALFSSAFNKGLGCSITEGNIRRVMALFTARRTHIHPKWYNALDEYIVPDENQEGYQEWNNDCFIYSIFNNKGFHSSMRDVDYREKRWNIYNEFFWISKEKLRELGYEKILLDVEGQEDRFMYKHLKELKLSPLAREVLNSANKLFEYTFEARESFARDNPQYHLDSWDAGYTQLKWLWKRKFKPKFKEFRKLYGELEKVLKPKVYEFGFLK